MPVAALTTWLLTAVGGFYLLGTWLAKGGPRQRQTRFPAPVIFGHFLLAAAGLVVWIIYVITDSEALTWTAFIILLPVALLGFTMLARWIPVYRAAATDPAPAERSFPPIIVAAHGVLAATTLVLVLLTALGIGES